MRWKLGEKRAIKDFEKVIKGNEAKILAIYQATSYMRLDHSPEGLQKLLNSLADQNISVGDKTEIEKAMVDIRSYLNKCDNPDDLILIWDFGQEMSNVANHRVIQIGKDAQSQEVGKAIEQGAEQVNEGFIIALETIAHTLHRAADQIDKIKEDIGTGNIRLQDAMKKRDMILQEIGKWKPGEEL